MKKIFALIIIFISMQFMAACSNICFKTDNGMTSKNGIAKYVKPATDLNDMEEVRKQMQAEKKEIKILGIGNSWTRDSFRWICSMLHDAGYKATVGQAYLGSSTLQDQYFGIYDSSYTYNRMGNKQAVHSAYQYQKYTEDGKRSFIPANEKYYNGSNLTGVTLESIVADEKWDIIIFQQRGCVAGLDKGWADKDTIHTFTDKDGKEKTLQWDINKFIDLIVSLLPEGSPRPKIGISIPWSPASGTSDSELDLYYKNYNDSVIPKTNDERIAFYEKTHKMLQEKGLWAAKNIVNKYDFIANPGLAIYNARKNKHLSQFGWKMQIGYGDAHLAEGLPKYVAGMAMINAALGIRHSDFSWYPQVNTNSFRKGKDSKSEQYELSPSEETAWIARMCGEIY